MAQQLPPNGLDKGDSSGAIQNQQDLVAVALRDRYRCNLSWQEDGAGFKVSTRSEGQVTTEMSVLQGLDFSAPLSFQHHSNGLLLSAFLVYATTSITPHFNCLSPFLPLSGLSKQLIHHDKQPQKTERDKKQPHKKHRADFMFHHLPSRLRLLIYGDRTPVFRLGARAQTETHRLTAWCRK